MNYSNLMQEIRDKIHSDIVTLMGEGIEPEQMSASVPNWIKDMLIEDVLVNTNYRFNNMPLAIFGVKIVPGYNNQICVFYDNADFNSPILKPIKIIKDKSNKILIEK